MGDDLAVKNLIEIAQKENLEQLILKGKMADEIIQKSDNALESIRKTMNLMAKSSEDFYMSKSISKFLKSVCMDISKVTKSEGAIVIIDYQKNSINEIESVGDGKKLAKSLKFIRDKDEKNNSNTYNANKLPSDIVESGIYSISYKKIIKNEENIGFVIVINGQNYGETDLIILDIFASQILLSINFFIGNQKIIDTALVDRDLEVISNQQKLIMEDELIHGDDKVNVDYLNIPYMHVGGDFLKFQKVSESSYFLFLADVMGHGIVSNYFVAMLKGALNTLLKLTNSPSNIMGYLNRILFEELDKMSTFVTAKAVYFDFKNDRMYSSNAGHTQPIMISEDGDGNKGFEIIKSESALALGILEDTVFQEEVRDMKNMKLFALYTDGIIEIKDENGEEFGLNRLAKYLIDETYNNPENICANLPKKLRDYSHSEDLGDDITIVTVHRK